MATANMLENFINRKDVKVVTQLNQLIADEFFQLVKGADFKHDTSIFNCSENSILIFDTQDYNSAFVHEYFMNNFNDGIKFNNKVDLLYMQSSDEMKKFIKFWHTNVWEMTPEQLNKNSNAKFEIFIIFIKDGEIMAKSDDYDIINQSTIDALFDIFND